MKSALKTAQNKTFRFEARTPNGKWFVCGRNVSAVEADAYAKKYLNDPNFRVVPAQLPFDATTIGQMLQHHISTRPPALSKKATGSSPSLDALAEALDKSDLRLDGDVIEVSSEETPLADKVKERGKAAEKPIDGTEDGEGAPHV